MAKKGIVVADIFHPQALACSLLLSLLALRGRNRRVVSARDSREPAPPSDKKPREAMSAPCQHARCGSVPATQGALLRGRESSVTLHPRRLEPARPPDSEHLPPSHLYTRLRGTRWHGWPDGVQVRRRRRRCVDADSLHTICSVIDELLRSAVGLRLQPGQRGWDLHSGCPQGAGELGTSNTHMRALGLPPRTGRLAPSGFIGRILLRRLPRLVCQSSGRIDAAAVVDIASIFRWAPTCRCRA